jgi:hypothetical protein
MTVTVSWYDPKQEIVLYVFEGHWTWDELYAAYNQAIVMEKSAPYRVDVVLDLLKSKSVPANALLHVKNISNKQPENLGLTVIVTPNAFVRALYNAGTQFYKGIAHYFRVVPTVAEALQMIADDRQEHNNQPIGKAAEQPTSRPASPSPPHKEG